MSLQGCLTARVEWLSSAVPKRDPTPSSGPRFAAADSMMNRFLSGSRRINSIGSTMPSSIFARLSLMTALLYGMLGIWFVTLGTYMSKGLGFDSIIGAAYGLQGLASILSVLFAGFIADRFFSAEKLLGVLAIGSSICLFMVSLTRNSETMFLVLLFLHFLFYVPMLPLSAAICFGASENSASRFPLIRAFGTLAWVLAGVAVGLTPGAASTVIPMQIGAALGLGLGLYAFTLPHTPPKAAAAKFNVVGLLGLDVVLKNRDRSFWVFASVFFMLNTTIVFYNAYGNAFLSEVDLHVLLFDKRIEPAAIQALGQVSEIVFLALLPLVMLRVRIKGVISVAMIFWVVRYVLFAFGHSGGENNLGFLFVGILLHGVCQDFFIIASQIYADRHFGEAARSRGQSFLMTILGGGALIGANCAGVVYSLATISPARHDWQLFWLVPAVISGLILICFAAFFRDRDRLPASG